MNPETLKLILTLMDVSVAAISRLGPLMSQVKAMVDEGRDPTPEEIAVLVADGDALTQGLEEALATALVTHREAMDPLGLG